MKTLVLIFALAVVRIAAHGADGPDRIFPVRGLSIAAPSARQMDRFIRCVEEDLAPRGVNTLILRVDYNYQYESHPELRAGQALSRADVKRLVEACRARGMKIAPQINLLGHQSWAGQLGQLLKVYPEFDETPWVTMPEKYVWPNPDGLYCKSYCPLHPKVHEVVFALMDEICDAFETDAFHAGMDEVFYLGEEKCPRCGGKNKAELFAGELKKIRDHLAAKNRALWIWGDRLIDGRTTGIGEWEASFNQTHPALELIPKDIVVCDWHYERADPTAALFALKGFPVVTCPWNRPAVGVSQVRDLTGMREQSTREVRGRLQGIVQTVWSGADSFMNGLDAFKRGEDPSKGGKSDVICFVKVFEEMKTLGAVPSQ
ncbi:MAG: family 20 glycosylhydrolase [Verrucomicrobiales bacterium]|nr:family 20 glycosylhydrolase [Verrucomicrobiales bacterium]